ncbi:hypothetical protein C1645_829077 [Glomus cerebriforme]|uniref:Methyltransferase type 11 domain-containing protein n=1 Tax=Glomus cerebriforme TaxID=658196 RepID=A0A397SRK0_9GLOM|nr:hypothetical protein C1645_829077 [Glomus cerebriforme]
MEISRLEMSHLLVKYLWKSNFSSPIHDKLTNERTWLLDMAKMYPKATFIGIDISPIFPKTNLSNVTFFVTNVLNGLPFENNTFDFVF